MLIFDWFLNLGNRVFDIFMALAFAFFSYKMFKNAKAADGEHGFTWYGFIFAAIAVFILVNLRYHWI